MSYDSCIALEGVPTPECLGEHIENVSLRHLHILFVHAVKRTSLRFSGTLRSSLRKRVYRKRLHSPKIFVKGP